MRRLEIPTKDDKLICHVGYDSALDTYYGHVARKLVTEHGKIKDGMDGHTILRIGTTQNEIDAVEELRERLAAYAAMSDDDMRSLRAMREGQQPVETKVIEQYRA